MKTKIIDSKNKKFSNPKMPKGWSQWVEQGIWYKARSVNKRKYGGHHYDNGDGTGDCICGCYMGDSSSSGPVDPFGPCPMNPLIVNKSNVRIFNKTRMKDPLTKKEHKDFINTVIVEYNKYYKALLNRANSVSLKREDGKPFGKSSHFLARIAIMRAAKDFESKAWPELKKELTGE